MEGFHCNLNNIITVSLHTSRMMSMTPRLLLDDVHVRLSVTISVKNSSINLLAGWVIRRVLSLANTSSVDVSPSPSLSDITWQRNILLVNKGLTGLALMVKFICKTFEKQ